MTRTIRSLCLSLFIPLLACGEDHDVPAELDFREGTAAPPRPPGGAGYVNNGLHDPQLGGIDPHHPLSTVEGLDGSLLDDPDRLATAQYVVECALPEGASVTTTIDGVATELFGALGLAPEWEDESCDQDCQEWVTACLLARTNVSGQTVPLWLKGDHPALGSGTSLHYPIYEASFFGNLFVDPNAQYLCPGLLVGPLLAQLDSRTCSALLGGYCDMTSYLLCTELPLLNPRCDVDGLLSPMALDCRPGTGAGGAEMRTISTYVQAL